MIHTSRFFDLLFYVVIWLEGVCTFLRLKSKNLAIIQNLICVFICSQHCITPGIFVSTLKFLQWLCSVFYTVISFDTNNN